MCQAANSPTANRCRTTLGLGADPSAATFLWRGDWWRRRVIYIAYGNQPNIAKWNLARLADTLLPLLAEDEVKALTAAEESLGSFAAIFQAAYLGGLRRKLGLAAEHKGDAELAQDLLSRMAESHAMA
jgi:uncharacterized protein YdiU (UPF0061 family)